MAASEIIGSYHDLWRPFAINGSTQTFAPVITNEQQPILDAIRSSKLTQ
ncbi:hypothetical protein QFZ36_001566 [Pseudarthrobacter siccitolerans]|uniref:Uncharacterized protein n=1 Tax=Pseudarthrobacter siccitolerans TaxID=861266 RepID=A0ABU0PJ64_9MICC|nr:hypothetical protein [Pseudarthrobacter siccitolerans]MDQ0674005.1 hypothetical protein [Pseudarthrobacter siccitolerans]